VRVKTNISDTSLTSKLSQNAYALEIIPVSGSFSKLNYTPWDTDENRTS
jgi:hypothetical protein